MNMKSNTMIYDHIENDFFSQLGEEEAVCRQNLKSSKQWAAICLD